MKNRNDNIKKWLLVAAGIVVSVVLIIMIGSKFKNEPVAEADISQQSIENNDVVVDTSDKLDTEDSEVTVPPVEIKEDNGQDGGSGDSQTEQKIQEDVPDKPTYTKEQLTDPTQKPNGEKVDSPKESETDTTPTPTPKPVKTDTKSDEKAETDSSGGLPGFDNVPDGGDNQVIDGDSDGDIDKEVGTMD